MADKNVSERIVKIVDYIKGTTVGKDAYILSIVPDSEPGILDSKFGGVPYWVDSMEYPVDSEGDKLMLLAQINFTKMALSDERLPNQGILQFFISSTDECFGMDFDEGDSQKDFRVIYHEEINESVTKEQVLDMDIPIATDEKYWEYSPVMKECMVEITKQPASMSVMEYTFHEIFAKAVLAVTGEDIGEDIYWDYLEDEECDYLYEELPGDGHCMLGAAYFTQDDPREYDEELRCYDTLLLQIDSDIIDGEDYVLWGDLGVGNFFIKAEDLKKRDFSKVLYNWDCS